MTQKTPCSRCGYLNRVNEVACLHCGTRFESAPPPVPAPGQGGWTGPSSPPPPYRPLYAPSEPPKVIFAPPVHEQPKTVYAPPTHPYPPQPVYPPVAMPPAHGGPVFVPPPSHQVSPQRRRAMTTPAIPPGQGYFYLGNEGGWQPGQPGMWNTGRQVVCARHASLPEGCVKCGAPTVERRVKKIYWHEPWFYALLLVGPVIYGILALILRKEAQVEYGLCRRHLDDRQRLIFRATATMTISVLLFCLSYVCLNGWIALLGGIGLVAAAIQGAIVSTQPIRASRITEHYAWIEGVTPVIREMLPPEP